MDKPKILEKRPRSRSPRIEDQSQSQQVEDTITVPLTIGAPSSRNDSPTPKDAKNLLDLSPSFHNGGSSGNLPELCKDNYSRPGSGSSSGKSTDDAKSQKSLLELCPAFHNTTNSTVSTLPEQTPRGHSSLPEHTPRGHSTTVSSLPELHSKDRGSPQRNSPDRPRSNEGDRPSSTQSDTHGSGPKKVHFSKTLEDASKKQANVQTLGEPKTQGASNPDRKFLFQAASKVLKSEVEITSHGSEGSPDEKRKYPVGRSGAQLSSSPANKEPKIFVDKRSQKLVVIAGDGGKVDVKDGKLTCHLARHEKTDLKRQSQREPE